MKIIVNKEQLLVIIKKNRDGHRAVFEKALEGYRKKMLELLENEINRIKNGEIADRYIGMAVPKDHTADYDRIISMLEMDIRKELEIEENQYRWYVLDNWDWKEEWTSTNTAYLAVE